MAERSPESTEMRTPAILSVMFHVLVLGAAVLNLDFFNRPPLMDPEPVMVEFEAIDKKAAAPTVGNPPPQPKEVPIAKEATAAAGREAQARAAQARRRPDRAQAQGARAAQGREAARAAQACARGQEARAAQARAA